MPLRQAAEKAGIFVGTALNYNTLHSDASYARVAAEQYNLVTAENGCKWQATEPNYNQFTFTQCDYDYQFAKAHNMTFRGHNLCWSQDNPSWLENGNYSPQQLTQILQNHISSVMGHYPGNEIYAWDVVNEAVDDNPSQQLYKNCVWYPAVPNYVDIAFQAARKANSGMKLFYNDYNILMDSGWMAAKSNAVYGMLKNMTQRGIPVDGIGIQTHLNLGDSLDYNSIVSNFQRFADLGLEVHITEMDVQCGTYTNGQMVPCSSFTEQLAEKQAEFYQTVLKACMAVSKCKNFETWGFTDKYTWTGSNEYPLPFDTNFQPKDAAVSIENQLLS
jgi:endo-1,4-beta-xylanase